MISAPIPSNEETRLSQLIAYHILDTESESAIDDITRTASLICKVPIALVTLVDRDRQWFKSAYGVNDKETARDISFCGHAIHHASVMEVADATKDPRFFNNPLVLDGPKIRFYAGAPLMTPNGFAIGTLCVIDKKPGELSAEQTESLFLLARQVIHLFELRLKNKEIKDQYNEIKKYALLVAEQKQQLFYSSKMVSMGQMATGLAHEINNPLAILLGRLELLRRSSQSGFVEPEKMEKSLVTMIHTTQRIADIIRGLKAFARDGTADPMEELDLNAIIDDTCKILNHLCLLENVHLTITCEKDLVGWGVPVHVSQILVNLISNAIDAIDVVPDRWIQIDARNANHGVLISVTDAGGGVPAALQEKIMQPFYTTKPVGKGTGLGLSISKGLAESMGGKLSLDTTKKNTCFEFSLPKVPVSSKKLE